MTGSVLDSVVLLSPFVKGGNSVNLPLSLGFCGAGGELPEFSEEKTLPGAANCHTV